MNYLRNVRNKKNVSNLLIFDIIYDDIVFAETSWFKMLSDQFTGIVTDEGYIPSHKTTGYTMIHIHNDQIKTVYLHIQP